MPRMAAWKRLALARRKRRFSFRGVIAGPSLVSLSGFLALKAPSTQFLPDLDLA